MNTTALRVVDPDAATRDDGSTVTLGTLLAATAPDTVRVVRAPGGLGVGVAGVVGWDLAAPASEVIDAGDLVLVTVDSGPHLLRRAADQAAERGAAGIVIRRRDLHADWVAATELTVLCVRHARSWQAVRRELLAALALHTASGAEADADLRLDGGDDLHSLADDVASALGGPVLVTGKQLEVLAHSARCGDLDGETKEWIIQRVPPTAVRAAGVMTPLLRSDRVVPVRGPGGREWQAVSLRAGGETLGALWCAGAGVDDPNGREVLARAARNATVRLARAAEPEPLSRLRSDLMHAAVSGHGWSCELAELVAENPTGRADRTFRLLALRAPAGQENDRRLERFLALRLGVTAPRLATTCSDGRIYVLAAATGRLVEAVRDAVQRARRRGWAGLRCVVGDPVELSGLPHAREEVDGLLDLITRASEPAVVDVAGYRGRSVIAELAGMTAERPCLLRGPMQQLAELDAAEQTPYVRTLRAYFDAGQDVQRAARALYIHRNTMRYRLGRIRALAGLDLDDPVDRLVAELQMRLHDVLDGKGWDEAS